MEMHFDGVQDPSVRKSRLFEVFPIPGIEPEPAGWKPAILATRPYGITHSYYNLKITSMRFSAVL